MSSLKRAKSVLYNISPDKKGFKKCKTRIVCTIGPKSNTVEMLCQLLDHGMCVARLNTAHGDFSYHQSILDNLSSACEIRNTICATMLDIKGPEIRTCKLQPNPERGDKKEWALKKGQLVTLTTDRNHVGDSTKFAITWKKLPLIVKPRHTRVLVADGLIGLLAISTSGDEITCLVENDSVLGENKNVNIPGEIVDLPAVTEKDIEFVAFGVKNEMDFIAGSFIRKAQDIRDIRELSGVKENNIKIIAKIENQEGIDNFDEILAETDGVMVARGDMGVEIPLPEVTTAQKMMIRKCNDAGKPVITATQMLESMIVNPRPTRAEVADIWNAVFDGSDCVMLSGETANGLFPIESVKIMNETCCEAEANINYRELFLKIRSDVRAPQQNVAESVASSAVKTAWDLSAAMVMALSNTGNTARLVSKYRPHCPILCVTPSLQTARQLLVTRGVFPYMVDHLQGTVEKTSEHALLRALHDGFVDNDQYVVVTSGHIEGKTGGTSLMRVCKITENTVQFAL